jgi:hypothetical protein
VCVREREREKERKGGMGVSLNGWVGGPSCCGPRGIYRHVWIDVVGE